MTIIRSLRSIASSLWPHPLTLSPPRIGRGKRRSGGEERKPIVRSSSLYALAWGRVKGEAEKYLGWLASPAAVWGLWAITRAVLLANLVIGHHYSDPQFYQYAGDFAVGKLPYRDVPVEYPPVAILLIVLPALPLLPFAGIAPRPEPVPHPLHPNPVRYGAYGISFGLMMLAIDALTLVLVQRFARRYTPGDATGGLSGLVYVALIFLSGTLLQKFDLATGILLLVAAWLWIERRDGWAWAVLALAALTKGYPVLLAPVFVIWRLREGPAALMSLKRALAGGAAAVLAVLGPVLVLAGAGSLIHSIAYNTGRGMEIESAGASLVLAVGWLPGQHITTTFDPLDLSRDVHAPLVGVATALAWPALAFLALWVYREQWRLSRRATDPMLVLAAALTLALGFMLCFPALPAHYLLGIIPLAAVIRLQKPAQGWWMGLLAGAMALSQGVITDWHGLVALHPLPALGLIARNCALIAALIVLARAPAALAKER
jgi:hypothetical protein